MAANHRFEKMTSEDLKKIAPEALVIIPVGSVEQHGPHLPVGTDSYNVEQLAVEAAERTGNPLILVAPIVWYGSSHHHLKFCGTMSLRGETLLALLCDLGNSLAAGGFKRLFFLNGHGGNETLCREAARKLVNEDQNDMVVGAASYWTIVRDALSGIEGIRIPGHAGSFETSLQLARDETLVDHDARESLVKGTYNTPQYRSIDEKERESLRLHKLRGLAFFQRPDAFRKYGGVSEAPAKASRELGQEALEKMIQELADFFTGIAKQL